MKPVTRAEALAQYQVAVQRSMLIQGSNTDLTPAEQDTVATAFGMSMRSDQAGAVIRCDRALGWIVAKRPQG